MGLDIYYEAFLELGSTRSIGMDLGPIPWTAIDRYAQRHGYEGDDFEYLVQMVRALDEAFLKYTRDKREADGA